MPCGRRPTAWVLWAPRAPGVAPQAPAYLCGIRVLALQLFQVQLVDLPEDQQLPVQELHLLLDRLTVRELTKTGQATSAAPWPTSGRCAHTGAGLQLRVSVLQDNKLPRFQIP